MKALIFTKRTELPAAIQSFVKLLGLEKKIIKVIPRTEELEDAIKAVKPNFILIDGDFNPGDHEILQAIAALAEADVRRRFVQTARLPESVRLLPRIQAARRNTHKFPIVYFFMDGGSPVLREELGRLASISVTHYLESASDGQITAEVLKTRGKEVISSIGKAGSAIGKLGKAVGERFQHHVDKHSENRTSQ